jgi:hypothetical protein
MVYAVLQRFAACIKTMGINTTTTKNVQSTLKTKNKICTAHIQEIQMNIIFYKQITT